MNLPVEQRCPGSGISMVPRTYEIRKITDDDRANYLLRIERCEARGDHEEAEGHRQFLADWEREQGESRERLVCAVCGAQWLSPTAKGTARPHRRDDSAGPSWDRVRQLRKDIQALQEDLDRQLEALEP